MGLKNNLQFQKVPLFGVFFKEPKPYWHRKIVTASPTPYLLTPKSVPPYSGIFLSSRF
jgi:hypothetical protein